MTFVQTDKDHVLRMEECFQEEAAAKSTSGSSSSSSRPPAGKIEPPRVTESSQVPPSAPASQSIPLAVPPTSPVSVAVPTGIQYVVVPAALSTTVAPQVRLIP